MAITASLKETNFGVGDVVRVNLKVKEGEKTRTQIFEGMVIKIKGRDSGKSFTVRRIGAQKIGMEMIFPISASTVDKIEVVRKGTEGVRRAKLYYIRGKSSREIEKIYSRAAGKNKKPVELKKKVTKKVVKKVSSKTKTASKK